MKSLILFAATALCLLAACSRKDFTTDGAVKLSLERDTLRFDTVFATTGSTTRFIKIFNNNSDGIRLQLVRLGGGAASPFKINVNGTVGPVINNLSVNAGDSAYLFATVTINPNAAAQPFVVRDSVALEYNGNTQWIQLEAYGQNARFLRNAVISGTQTWDNRLPYVLSGTFTVDTNATLTIGPGTRIYTNARTPILVHGSLQVLGTAGDSNQVQFRSDRLDAPYNDYPAGYPGIVFSAASKNNRVQFAQISNAYQAVVVAGPNSGAGPKLQLWETVIQNCYDAAVLAGGTSIDARNVVVRNSGKGVQLLAGGDYNFTHCTLASFGDAFITHKDPTLVINNGTTTGGAALNALFTNCIIWGDSSGLVPNEVVINRTGSTAFNVRFNAVLWRVKDAPAQATITAAINNQSPQFDSINISKRIYNLRLSAASPAINKGVATAVTFDADGKPRAVGVPDLGAYERQ